MNRRRLLTGALALGAAVPWAATLAATPVADPNGYAHPEWLVDAAWLQEHLGDEELVVVALTAPEFFEKGHIPGAEQVDWPDLALSESAQIDAWRGQMETLLTQLGIERADTVVIADIGTLYSARLWWILYQLGHADIRILNGGMPAWTAAGGELETGAATPTPAAQPYIGEPNDDAIATVDEVVAALDDPHVVLVDARSEAEFAQGHIPGAVNYPNVDVVDTNDPALWKSADALIGEFAALGVTQDKLVIPYCSSGVRSAVLYFTLRLIGFPNVSLYSGSFDEWTADPARPVETGG